MKPTKERPDSPYRGLIEAARKLLAKDGWQTPGDFKRLEEAADRAEEALEHVG
jgi:hypothetical protein